MLKRYGEKALEESATRATSSRRRRSRRRGDLAPDYRRRRAAREHNTARAGALIERTRNGRPHSLPRLRFYGQTAEPNGEFR